MSTAIAPSKYNARLNFQAEYENYHERLLNSMIAVTANRDEAEDVASAAFEAAFEHRAEFRGESSFYTWLHAIAQNTANRRWSRRSLFESLEATERPVSERFVEWDLFTQTLEKAECSQRIRQTLRRVPGLYRKVLMDRYIDGQSVRQIAKLRRIPLGTVLSRIFTAKQLLREAWGA
jgi:RNA polymerase sigma-70 factor (ECF subfamily)